MSPTETDFWSKIDSEPTADDVPTMDAEPQQTASLQSSSDDDPSDRSVSDRSEAGDRESLMHPAAAPELRVARPAESAPGKSKSQRIREFMDAHPEVRNRDIVEALGEYGVTAADVSNVRTQLRKKAEKQQKAKARVASSATPHAAAPHAAAPRTAGPRTAGRRTADASGTARGGVAAASSAARPAAGEIAMTEIEAGLSFIEQAGSIERARQVIELIARIREISLKG